MKLFIVLCLISSIVVAEESPFENMVGPTNNEFYDDVRRKDTHNYSDNGMTEIILGFSLDNRECRTCETGFNIFDELKLWRKEDIESGRGYRVWETRRDKEKKEKQQ
jgi:hypothetical protein